jgi:hypothetical protein
MNYRISYSDFVKAENKKVRFAAKSCRCKQQYRGRNNAQKEQIDRILKKYGKNS